MGARTIEVRENEPDRYPRVAETAHGDPGAYLTPEDVEALREAGEEVPPGAHTDRALFVAFTTAWQRVEAYTAHRWAPRAAEFIVDGSGCWQPPLHPFVAETLEHWHVDGWEPVEVRPSPYGGLELSYVGPFRVFGTAGADVEPPAAVRTAVFRLLEYELDVTRTRSTERTARSVHKNTLAEAAARQPASEVSERLRGLGEGGLAAFDYETEGVGAKAMAQALQLSGAADLLRPYRRLGGR